MSVRGYGGYKSLFWAFGVSLVVVFAFLAVVHLALPFSEAWPFDLFVLLYVVAAGWGVDVLDKKRALPRLPHTFISYSRSEDSSIVGPLRKSILTTAKPIFTNRSRWALLDRNDLKGEGLSEHDLETAIVKLVGRAQFFVLLASPQAAASRWVSVEVNAFLREHSTEHLRIMLTSGDIAWDRASNDFAWDRTTALPRCLKGKYNTRPNYDDFVQIKTRGLAKKIVASELTKLVAPIVASMDRTDVATVHRLVRRQKTFTRIIIALNLLFVSFWLLVWILLLWRKSTEQ